MTLIKALVVDYGGVLVESLSAQHHLDRIAQEVGIDADQLKESIYGRDRVLWNRAKVGLITQDEYRAEFERRLGLPTRQTDWVEYQLFRNPSPHTIFIDFLKAVHERYMLAILSNAIPIFSQTWSMLGFDELFDITINSSLVKLAKPNPEIYKLTAKGLNLPPEACLCIDDQLKNVSAASQLGFQVVHYLHEEQAIGKIREYIRL